MCGSDLSRLAPALLASALTACIGAVETIPVPAAEACVGAEWGQPAAIDWYRPADSGERGALDRWCAAVGPPVILRNRSTAAWGPDDSLRILVWNVSAGGGDLERFLQREAGTPCAPAGPAARPFVLLAQEAFRRSDDVPAAAPGMVISRAAAERPRPGPREDVVSIARRCGLTLFYVPAVRNGPVDAADGREDRGNALLANVPLDDFVVIELPAEDSRRLAIAATVRSPAGDSVRLVSLHFTLLPRLWGNLTTGNAARVRHALGLVDALRRIEAARGVAGGIATVAAGDANTWSRRDAAARRLRAAFPQSPPPLATPTRGPFPADHVWFRRADAEPGGALDLDSYRRVDLEYSSDHHPLTVSYVFRP